jgi:hypothetical protein
MHQKNRDERKIPHLSRRHPEKPLYKGLEIGETKWISPVNTHTAEESRKIRE